MRPAEIFRRAAAESEHMAKLFARNLRAFAFREIAERWFGNAELFDRKEVSFATAGPS
jgi:hypothetical protein